MDGSVPRWYEALCSRAGNCCTMVLQARKNMMKIRYQNGHAVEAITLSRTENTLRVALSGSDDVLEVNRVSGIWVTDDCEPVTIEFQTRRTPAAPVDEEDCICPAELASHLIHLLLNDSSEDEAESLAPATERKPFVAARIA